MRDDVNVNQITAEFLLQAIKGVSESIVGTGKTYWNKYFSSFGEYLEECARKYGHTKTILYKDRSVPLSDLYVETKLSPYSSQKREDVYDESDITQKLENGDNVIVSATAGSGKSFLVRYLFLSLISSCKKIPLFVELRNLNNSSRTIVEIISNDLKNHGVDVGPDIVQSWIESGQFVLILDGYDELSISSVSRVTEEIKNLSESLVKSSLIVTTRPTEDLEHLSEFEIFRINRLDKSQAINIVTNINYDPDVKDNFIKQLSGGLFEKHEDFLSNPLLLTIMLMTYGEIAEIPSKIHIFYEQAFDVLYYRHDASKNMYKREILSGLAIDDFKDVLASVSMSGYIRSKLNYSNTDLITYIRRAKKLLGVNKLSPEKYKKDLLQSVCMFVVDGNRFSYNHRSFQEYFSALFITKFDPPGKEEIYDICLERVLTDNVLDMAFEMNRSKLEREFVYPRLQQLNEAINGDEINALKEWFEGMIFVWTSRNKTNRGGSKGEKSALVRNERWGWRFMLFLEGVYREHLGKAFPKIGGVMTKKAFKEELGELSEPLEVQTSELDDSQIELLERLGVLEIARRRVHFLKWLEKHLENRETSGGKEKIQEWL
ncbi:NACHT domain-containing protein [uncultured Halovibrio sp.]|uniref:NACHT domain-containing protein n=1 Tax=uncultured Halovibrio sp. TaxID=985049 RepID=UPI0025CF0396|nr:NACHT domain-containing protein [uncultured Halovibrio sp.]